MEQEKQIKMNNPEQNNLLKVKQKNIRQKQIVLKLNEEKSWIWKGLIKKDKSSKEEPAVLEFEGKNFYFYSNHVQERNYKVSTRRSELYKRLDYFQQEELLKLFTKKKKQEDWDNLILFTLKVDFLYTITNILYKNLYKKDIFLTDRFNNLKDKFNSEYQSLMTEIEQGIDNDLDLGKFEKVVVRNLKNRRGNLYDKIKKLVKKFEIKNPNFLVANVDKNDQKNQLIVKDLKDQEEILNFKQRKKQKYKIILLRNNSKQSWIWKGLTKKDENSLEDYVVLEFDNKNYYFYASEIEKKDYNYGSNFFKLYNKLDYFHQDQLLQIFTKQDNQEDWYRPMLLKLKVEFLDNIADILLENLDNNDNNQIAAFNNLKVKFVSEYQSLMTEIKTDVDNNLKSNIFESFMIKNLKNNKSNLYNKFEKLVAIFKEENLDFNELEAKDLKMQRLFFNSKQKKVLRSKTILLRNIANHSWLWKGVIEKDEFSLEEPVVLKLDNSKLYFYSKAIEKRDYKYNNNVLRLYKNLDYFHQEELLKAFAKHASQEYWYKSTLMKMKVNFLDNMADVLYENLYKDDNMSSSEFDDLKDKFLSEYESLMTDIKEDYSEPINDSMMSYDVHLGNFFKSLKNKKGKLYEKFETLIKHLKEENPFLKKDFLMISLKYYQNNSLLWKGESEKDESSLEEPAVLKFDNKDYYFYPSQIAKRNYNYNKKFFKLYSKLDYFHQEELLKVFNKQDDKQVDKSILFKMKGEFLVNLADFLSENLDEKQSLSIDDFNNLKVKFVFEYKSLIAEIDQAAANNLDINKLSASVIKNLKNRKGTIYHKFEKLITKFQTENLDFNELIKNFKNHELVFNYKPQKQLEFKTILLNNGDKYSLLWKGVRKKDEYSLEDPLVLTFDNQDFYFYQSEIEKKNYRLSTRAVELYKRLDYFQQEELLKAFAKQGFQEDWYKWTLVKIKFIFLDTLSDVLSEALAGNGNLSIEEFINLKDKFISEYESFMVEIEQGVDSKPEILGIRHLKNKRGRFYYKFEELVEKLKANDITLNDLIEKNLETNQSFCQEQLELHFFNNNELLNNITESDAYDSLINDMIVDDKYQEYLTDNNLLFDFENDNNISNNPVDDLEEIDYPAMKKRKLNNSEPDLDISEFLASNLSETDIDATENNQNNFDSNIQDNLEQRQLETDYWTKEFEL